MSNGDLTTQQLEEKIRERRVWLQLVADFAELITMARGKVLKYEQGSSNTRIVRECRGFEGFSFRTDTGQTMMGGNTIKVWYHPDVEANCLNLEDPPGLVLHFWYQVSLDEDHAEVRMFDSGVAWRVALALAMTCRDEVIAHLELGSDESKQQRLKQVQEEKRRADLEAVVAKLKI